MIAEHGVIADLSVVTEIFAGAYEGLAAITRGRNRDDGEKNHSRLE